MSGVSSESPCPVCEESMNCGVDYKPFDMVFGECLNCGFYYETRTGQMPLKEVNDKRKEYNEDQGLSKNERLKPLTTAQLKKWKKEIDKI